MDEGFPKKPYIIFEGQNKISGNLGCNGFGANLEFEEEAKVKISKILSTQMACTNLKIEQQFLEILRNTRGYRIEENILILNDEDKKVIAKLVNK